MKKILIIDDERDIRFILSECISSLGHEVDEADSGESALHKMKTQAYDIVITDQHMPKISGTELIKIMRRDFEYKNMRFILTSGNTEKIGSDSTIDKVLEKPFTRDDLERTIDSFF